VTAGMAITGCGVLSPAGIGLRPLAAALAAGQGGTNALAGFDARQHLGRRGTVFLDRCTALGLVACGQALEDSGLEVGDGNRHRIGVALGTTMGSFRSMSDYTRETLVEERPYLVNPALFPNTVMNCAAGQSAIRHGLRGINATLAGGQLGILAVLRYAANALRRGYADAMLAGAVEELTPHRAWAARVTGTGGPGGLVGEGAVVLVVEHREAAVAAGRHVDAEVLSVQAGFSPGGTPAGVTRTLGRCVSRALAEAGLEPGQVTLVTSGAPGDEAAAHALGLVHAEPVPVRTVLGECHALSAALQVSALLAGHRDDPRRDARVWLVTAVTPEGGVAAGLIRGFSRGGADRQ
jgi:3-oxoacyl-[acyl-carrier-protein] synthase II